MTEVVIYFPSLLPSLLLGPFPRLVDLLHFIFCDFPRTLSSATLIPTHPYWSFPLQHPTASVAVEPHLLDPLYTHTHHEVHQVVRNPNVSPPGLEWQRGQSQILSKRGVGQHRRGCLQLRYDLGRGLTHLRSRGPPAHSAGLSTGYHPPQVFLLDGLWNEQRVRFPLLAQPTFFDQHGRRGVHRQRLHLGRGSLL